MVLRVSKMIYYYVFIFIIILVIVGEDNIFRVVDNFDWLGTEQNINY